MPHLVRVYKYNRVLDGETIPEVVAIITKRARGSRWYATAENQSLEEEAARELFPNLDGRYAVPTFALKPEDRTD